MNFAMAVIQNANPATELEAIRQLPLDKRYVWRAASVLERGFADIDDLSVIADRETLTTEAILRFSQGAVVPDPVQPQK